MGVRYSENTKGIQQAIADLSGIEMVWPERSIPISHVSFPPLLFLRPNGNKYWESQHPSDLLVDGVQTVAFQTRSGRLRLWELYVQGNNLRPNLRNKLLTPETTIVARNIIISRAGPDGGVLILCRRRNNNSQYGGYLETPGGKVQKEKMVDTYDGTYISGTTIADSIVQARVELEEEVGDLTPSKATKKGICVAMAEYKGKVFLETAEVTVVTRQTLTSLAQLANGRRDSDNKEKEEELGDTSPWLCNYYPFDLDPKRFLPTTRLNLEALFGNQSWVNDVDFKGVGIFLPYLNFSSRNEDLEHKWYLDGKRLTLWDLNLPDIFPAKMPDLRIKT